MIPLSVASFLHCLQYLIAYLQIQTYMGESSRVMSGRKKVDTWNAVSRPQTQTRLIPNPVKSFEALACNECPSLTSQTQHFHEQGNGPVNCMYIQVVSYWNAIR